MGRVKLKIKRLESTSNRQVTYSKRRNGILKKAKELSILCDIDIVLLMFSPTGKATLFRGERSNIEEVITKFAQMTPQERTKRKLESLEALKKTFKKLDHDVNIQDFLGSSTQSIEELSSQMRMMQAQLTEAHKRLSCWSNPDKIDNIEHLSQMEESLRESLNQIRMQKENFVKHPFMSLECTNQFQNGMHFPLMMGGMQDAQPLSWFTNNENQHMILTGEPNYLPQRDIECSNNPSLSTFSSFFSPRKTEIENTRQVDVTGQEGGALNELDYAACLRLQLGEQYPCQPYSSLDLHDAKKLKPEIYLTNEFEQDNITISVGAMNTESEPNEKREIEKVDNTEAVVDEIDGVSKRIPPWTKQVTVRGVIASIVIGCVYSVIAMKLNLTTGLSPHLNVSAALLAFIFMRAWTKLLGKAGIVSTPFTRQENTMIQTCSVACYSIAVGGGFGSYLLALNKKTYEQTGVNTVGNSPGSYKEPGYGWMTGFLFVVCFIGLFVLIPLRKILIVDYKLTFPSGMATAVLINGFHNQGEQMARKQVRGFMKVFSLSFLWGFFQWFYSGKDICGFAQFPTFGLRAWKNTFYFDFSMTYVGTGMICPHIVNLSTLVGAVLSWGVMWPLLANFKGLWFPSTIPESSMKSLNGYKVFLSIALLLGDGIYNFIKVICITFLSIHGRLKQKKLKSAAEEESSVKSLDILKQNEVFIRESIPMWVGASGYILFTVISVIVIPFIFPEVKWYYVIMSYLLAPSLAFCNAYGAGLTDINMSYNYGKVGLFALAALAGKQHGVVAGLAGCGLMKSVISVSCILMQDLKTGHLTLTSPRTMLVSQAIGTAIGCVVSPLCFLLFYKAFDVGNPNGEYKAPYAVIYRNIAILGVQGFSALPYHCLQLCYGFFAFAVGINLVKDFSPPRIGKWMPLPMAMAVPFLVGAYFSIDMCVGTLIVFVWHKLNPKKAELMVPVVASGLICGEGLWTLPESILSLAGVNPPMCMKFVAS